MKNIYCIVGPSGCGKTTLVEALEKEYGYKAIDAYKDGVNTDLIEKNDLYVIDPAGVAFLKEKYNGSKGIKVIGLEASPDVLIERMQKRGDSEEKIIKRLVNDKEMFRGFQNITDIILRSDINTVEELCYAVKYHIEYFEDKAKHEFTLFDENGKEVSSGHKFYDLEEARSISKVRGMPENWTFRDDTELKREQYVRDIKRAQPSLKSSLIEVHMEDAGVFDGLLVVPFKYKDTEYVYRDYLYKDEKWINKREPYITEPMSSRDSFEFDIHLLKKKMVRLEEAGEPTAVCETGIRFLEKALATLESKGKENASVDALIADAQDRAGNGNFKGSEKGCPDFGM